MSTIFILPLYEGTFCTKKIIILSIGVKKCLFCKKNIVYIIRAKNSNNFTTERIFKMLKTIIIDVFPYGGDYKYTKDAKKNYESIVEFFNIVANALKVNTTATWDLGCYRVIGAKKCELDVVPCIHCVLTSARAGADYLGQTMVEYIKTNYKYNALFGEVLTKKAYNHLNRTSKRMGIRRDVVLHQFNTNNQTNKTIT